MAREDFLWGAPRINGELLKLGYDVSQATVSRSLRGAGGAAMVLVAAWSANDRKRKRRIEDVACFDCRAVVALKANSWLRVLQDTSIQSTAIGDGRITE
jgi:hypothetical protein